jgi:hypothetical protein
MAQRATKGASGPDEETRIPLYGSVLPAADLAVLREAMSVEAAVIEESIPRDYTRCDVCGERATVHIRCPEARFSGFRCDADDDAAIQVFLGRCSFTVSPMHKSTRMSE